VDEKLLNSYVGTYEVGRGTLVVSRVGKALALQQNGQPAINELVAQTPARFLLRGSNITITFESDAAASTDSSWRQAADAKQRPAANSARCRVSS
jgi:hypothetical protein